LLEGDLVPYATLTPAATQANILHSLTFIPLTCVHCNITIRELHVLALIFFVNHANFCGTYFHSGNERFTSDDPA